MYESSSPNNNKTVKSTSSFRELPALFDDDIECKSWLLEISLPQYTETFLANFSVGNNLLSRKRLNTLRLQDFPQMNITIYDHQKILIEHIRFTLQYSFDSPLRIKYIQERLNESELISNKNHDTIAKSLPVSNLASIKIDISKKRASHRVSPGNRRKSNFDNQAWSKISKIRDSDGPKTSLENLREGNITARNSNNNTSLENTMKNGNSSNNNTSRRRHTMELDENTDNLPLNNSNMNANSNVNANKGINYGNMALEYDSLLNQLKKLQNEQLTYYKNIINCEIANILFINDRTRELMLFTNEVWYKISMDSGIAGYCARTGKSFLKLMILCMKNLSFAVILSVNNSYLIVWFIRRSIKYS